MPSDLGKPRRPYLAVVQLCDYGGEVHRGFDYFVVIKNTPVLRVDGLVERPRVFVRHAPAKNPGEEIDGFLFSVRAELRALRCERKVSVAYIAMYGQQSGQR